MLKGYIFEPDGTHTPAVSLADAEAAVAYARLHGAFCHEVRIVDEDDYIIIQVIRGRLVFPVIS
ncbi:MAG: hypothetical protein PHC40_04945 [Eubacteriales bacterium]|nr:hypothetical protein [Eubacteriales bacterium]